MKTNMKWKQPLLIQKIRKSWWVFSLAPTNKYCGSANLTPNRESGISDKPHLRFRPTSSHVFQHKCLVMGTEGDQIFHHLYNYYVFYNGKTSLTGACVNIRDSHNQENGKNRSVHSMRGKFNKVGTSLILKHLTESLFVASGGGHCSRPIQCKV